MMILPCYSNALFPSEEETQQRQYATQKRAHEGKRPFAVFKIEEMVVAYRITNCIRSDIHYTVISLHSKTMQLSIALKK